MNPLHHLLSSPAIERLGWTLLHFLWEGCVVAATLALALFFLRRVSAQARYLMSCTALAALAALPVITFLSLPDTVRPVAATHLAAPIQTPQFQKTPSPEHDGAMAAPAGERRSVGAYTAARGSTLSEFLRAPSTWFSPFLAWLVVAWAAGVMSFSLWNLCGYVGVHRLRSRNTRPVQIAVQNAATRIARDIGLSRAVRLLQSALAESPLVIGALKPVILLPASVLTELPTAQLESLLAHELAHVLRHDYLINLVQSMIETMLFYHPAVWWVSRQIRVERENCCDDIAVAVTRDRASYVRALAAVASVRLPALAPAASGGKLLPRLRRVMGIPDSDSGRSPRWAAGAIVIVTLFTALLISRFSGPARADDKPVPSADVVNVHGRVLDPAGHPAAGVNVFAVSGNWSESPEPLSRVRSAADGTFDISFRKSTFDHVITDWESVVVVAAAPGVGPGWARWDDVNEANEVVLKLAADDVPIEGRILDVDAKPVKGAQVTVEFVLPHATQLKDMNIDGSDPAGDGALLPGWVAVPHPVTTGADGTFRINGIGRNRKANVGIRGPGISSYGIEVLTRQVPTESRTMQQYLAGTFTTYGAKFDYTAAPGRVVTGTVRDAATMKPMAGVVVSNGGNNSTTDDLGRYRVEGVRKGKEQRMNAKPPIGEPYFYRNVPVPDAPGLGPVTVDIELHRGIWVTGKVTEKVTGEPVLARVTFQPYLSNPYAAKLPEFHEGVQPAVPDGDDNLMTAPDGSYRLVGMPGPALIVAGFPAKRPYLRGIGIDPIKCPKRNGEFAVYRPFVGFNVEGGIKEVNIPEHVEQATGDFQFDPGMTLHIKMLDPQGKPLSGVMVGPARPGVIGFVQSRSPVFDALAFSPQEERREIFRYVSGKLGKAIKIKPADAPNGEVIVTLEPWATITGRLIGQDGQPLPDAMLGPYMWDGPSFGTDKQGRFTLTLAPGLPYPIRGIKGNEEFTTDVGELTVKPGESEDLGDVHWKSF